MQLKYKSSNRELVIESCAVLHNPTRSFAEDFKKEYNQILVLQKWGNKKQN